MIGSLEDAKKWYEAIKTLAQDVRHLAKMWDIPEWEPALSRDNRLRSRSSADLLDMSETILADLDDLTVLVLFSVFEATVRSRAGADIDREIALISHVAVKQAVAELKEAIASGSFAKVTKAFQRMDKDLTEQVNQVREFRNWVAHGRRDKPKNQVSPAIAIERLRRYLDVLAETQSDEAPPTPIEKVAPPKG